MSLIETEITLSPYKKYHPQLNFEAATIKYKGKSIGVLHRYSQTRYMILLNGLYEQEVHLQERTIEQEILLMLILLRS